MTNKSEVLTSEEYAMAQRVPNSAEVVQARLKLDKFETLWRIGKMCSGSGFFQDAREANQACVKIQAGEELGFPPVVAMTQIYIVKGRVSLSASLMAAALRKAGYDYRLKKHDGQGCEIEFFGKKGESLGSTAFLEADAKLAGLLGGDNWKKYPRNMYFARAMSNGVRFFAPDALGGHSVYTPEELGADVDEGGTPLKPPAVPAVADDLTAEVLAADKPLDQGGVRPAVQDAMLLKELDEIDRREAEAEAGK